MINRRKEKIHTAIEYLFIFLCRETYLIAILYCACSSIEATPFEIFSLNSLIISYLEPIKENNTVKTLGNETFWKDLDKTINDYVNSVTLDQIAKKNAEGSNFNYCI